MVKDTKHTLRESPTSVKKPYEPCKLEIIELKEDVMLASSPYSTKGSYDGLGGWDLFGGGII